MSGTLELPICRLPHGADLALPAYGSAGSAGLDLLAAIGGETDVELEPGERCLVPCGISIALPPGYEAQVRPRSGLALKAGLTVLNSPGTIDSDYRGEIGVILINHGQQMFVLKRGMRIAQMIIAPVIQAALVEVQSLPESTRGAGGFGSTGVGG
jgi:dUTP pyrophosphatase